VIAWGDKHSGGGEAAKLGSCTVTLDGCELNVGEGVGEGTGEGIGVVKNLISSKSSSSHEYAISEIKQKEEIFNPLLSVFILFVAHRSRRCDEGADF
jgi:hypothetical protein